MVDKSPRFLYTQYGLRVGLNRGGKKEKQAARDFSAAQNNLGDIRGPPTTMKIDNSKGSSSHAELKKIRPG